MHSLDGLIDEILCTQGANIRPKETFTHHRNSVILHDGKEETQTKCLRIVYAEFYAKNASKESKKWLIAPDYNLEVLKIRI